MGDGRDTHGGEGRGSYRRRMPCAEYVREHVDQPPHSGLPLQRSRLLSDFLFSAAMLARSDCFRRVFLAYVKGNQQRCTKNSALLTFTDAAAIVHSDVADNPAVSRSARSLDLSQFPGSISRFSFRLLLIYLTCNPMIKCPYRY